MQPLLVVAIGQTLVLITGGIDLSVTSIIGLTSISGAMIMNSNSGLLANHPLAFPLGVLAMLLIGGSVGLINGVCVSLLRMAPFIVTLISMMFFNGLAVWLTKSKKIYHLPENFLKLGYDSFAGLAWAAWIVILLALAVHFFLQKTAPGQRLYCIGLNSSAAFISGIRVKTLICGTYIACGFCAALGSILYTSRLETGSPVLGQNILLDVIGAVVIGGTSLFGGKGKVLWTIYGVLFITLLNNSLSMMSLSHFNIMMVKGSVILCAAFLDVVRAKWSWLSA